MGAAKPAAQGIRPRVWARAKSARRKRGEEPSEHWTKMARIVEGKLSGRGRRFAVVVSRFNSVVTDKLLEGALDGLARAGVAPEDVLVVRVPGAFEIPVTAKRLAGTGRFGGVVCLGAVIKGETPHWEYLSGAMSHALAQAATETGVPFSFGVLTTETEEAALARAGVKGDNKGCQAALAAVEMADLFRQLDPGRRGIRPVMSRERSRGVGRPTAPGVGSRRDEKRRAREH